MLKPITDPNMLRQLAQSHRDQVFQQAQTKRITLDGEPAIIVGRLLPFPVVLTQTGKRAEVNWVQLEALIERTGPINVQS